MDIAIGQARSIKPTDLVRQKTGPWVDFMILLSRYRVDLGLVRLDQAPAYFFHPWHNRDACITGTALVQTVHGQHYDIAHAYAGAPEQTRCKQSSKNPRRGTAGNPNLSQTLGVRRFGGTSKGVFGNRPCRAKLSSRPDPIKIVERRYRDTTHFQYDVLLRQAGQRSMNSPPILVQLSPDRFS